jgi:hypothetical protein
MRFSGLAVLALAFMCVPSSYADAVHVQTAGHLLGDTNLQVGSTASFGFSLAADTQITSLAFGISAPDTGPGTGTFGTYSIAITGPGNTLDWSVTLNHGWDSSVSIPSFLSAGLYEVTFEGLSCAFTSCPDVMSLQRFGPATYTEIGGAITPHQGIEYGFDLVGSSSAPVPEPATATLLCAGLLGLAGAVRRSRSAAA